MKLPLSRSHLNRFNIIKEMKQVKPTATGFSGVNLDPKTSIGGSAGVTYSSIANIPKAKKTKLI
jgi:hypothetical protein